MTDRKPVALILCTGNSCRSQMAEGFLRAWAGEWLDVHSAGLEPKDAVHPLAVEVMKEVGVDLGRQHPKGLREFLGKVAVRYLVVVCSGAEESCPRQFLGARERHYWPFEDPARAEGTRAEQLAVFRRVRDQIAERLKAWIELARADRREDDRE